MEVTEHYFYGLTKTDLEEIIHILESNNSVEEVTLFGSRAKGNFKNESDIDLAIKGDKLKLDDLLSLSLDLDELYLPYRIDMIIYHHINNQELIDHIGRVGITLFKRT